MTVKQVIEYLEDLYPLKDSEPWDYSGLNVKNKLSSKLTGALLAIDLTNEVLNKAIELKCNLILTHHPFIFSDSWGKEYQSAPYKKEINSKLKEHNISVYSLHTNYDIAYLGTSHQVFKYLGLDEYNLRMIPTLYGVVFDNLAGVNLIEIIKEKFNYQNTLRSNFDPNQLKEFKRVAILAGSGSIYDINKLSSSLKVDLFITSDLKWNEWINYQEKQINVLEIPHKCEEVFAYQIMQDLEQILPKDKIYFKAIKLPYKNII